MSSHPSKQSVHRRASVRARWGVCAAIASLACAVAAGGGPAATASPKTGGELSAQASACIPAQSISVIVDDSGSMSSSDRRRIRKRAVELLVRKPSNQGRTLGAIEFGTDAGALFDPSTPATDQASMLSSLGALDADGYTEGDSTDYNAAFDASAIWQPDADARVFLTDGDHNEGRYVDGHRGGPRTYVVGLGIGPARQSSSAALLARIARDTGGRYFPLMHSRSDSSSLQLRRLQPAFNKIDALLTCQATPRQVTRKFTRSGQTSKPFGRAFGPHGAMELVATRPSPGVRCRLIRALVYDKRGRVIADLRGKRKISRRSKRRRARLDVRTVGGATYDHFTIVRPRGGVRIDVWVKVRGLRRAVPITLQLRPTTPPPAVTPPPVAPPPPPTEPAPAPELPQPDTTAPAPQPPQPDTVPPSQPTGLSTSEVTRSSAKLSWNASTDNVGVAHYSVYRNGTRLANVAGRSYRFTGLSCGTTYTLGVTASDAAGNRSARASRSVKTSNCPPPPTVTLSKGGSAQGLPGCVSEHCRYMNVEFKNFPSGSHTIRCRASHGDEGGFYTYTRSGTSNSSAVCYYGFDGRTAWVTVDGVSSNKIVW